MDERGPELQLPPSPSFMRTVPEPQEYEGQSATVAIAEHKVVIRTLNKRITSSKAWYESVRKNYSTKQ